MILHLNTPCGTLSLKQALQLPIGRPGDVGGGDGHTCFLKSVCDNEKTYSSLSIAGEGYGRIRSARWETK